MHDGVADAVWPIRRADNGHRGWAEQVFEVSNAHIVTRGFATDR